MRFSFRVPVESPWGVSMVQRYRERKTSREATPENS